MQLLLTTLRVASCGQFVSNVVMTVMLTFLINFYKTANRMENGNLEEGLCFPYLRHIFGLWWNLQTQKHLWCHQPQHMANMAAVSLLMCHRGSLILSLSWAHGHCICVCMQCNCVVCQKCTWSIPTQERFIAKYYSYYYICSCSKTVTQWSENEARILYTVEKGQARSQDFSKGGYMDV